MSTHRIKWGEYMKKIKVRVHNRPTKEQAKIKINELCRLIENMNLSL